LEEEGSDTEFIDTINHVTAATVCSDEAAVTRPESDEHYFRWILTANALLAVSYGFDFSLTKLNK
jgi:hypothetical protein